MNLITRILSVLFLSLAFVSCEKKENLDNIPPPVGLGGDTWEPTAVDKWLRDSLTVPYNIAVEYRWNGGAHALDKTLTPPDESKIIPAMSAVKRVWINPYNEETGSEAFIKKYAPKQFQLIGSVEYNYNGTVLLGQAEGGNNIAFFDINQNFDSDPVSSIKRMIQTSHHEFAHILHQNVLYPQEFKGISSSLGMTGYTATWYNVSTEQAQANGYITPYSMASYDEDFVEMVANMLMEGRSRFNDIVAAQNATAREALQRKERIVVNYFSEVWHIDFYSLQTRVQKALNSLVPPPDVADLYGPAAPFNTASVAVNDQALRPHSSGFLSMYNSVEAAVEALPEDYIIDSFGVLTPGDDLIYLIVNVDSAGVTKKTAFYGYDDVIVSGGHHQYTLFGANEFGEELFTVMTPLLSYFNNNTFDLSWYADPSITLYPRVKFDPLQNNDFFIGLLTQTDL